MGPISNSNREQAMCRIADALQVKLTLDNGSMTGARVAKFEPLPLLQAKAQIYVRGYLDSTHFGVLFHVVGNLYVLALHYYAQSTMTMFLIDSSRLSGPPYLTDPKADVPALVATLREGIAASFIWKDKQWHPMAAAQ